MISNYQLVVVSGTTSDKKNTDVAGNVKKIIADKKGKIVKEGSWGEKQLSYPIRKQSEGEFLVYDVAMEGTGVLDMGEKLKNMDGVLRYLVMRVEENKKKTKEDKKQEKKARVKKQSEKKA